MPARRKSNQSSDDANKNLHIGEQSAHHQRQNRSGVYSPGQQYSQTKAVLAALPICCARLHNIHIHTPNNCPTVDIIFSPTDHTLAFTLRNAVRFKQYERTLRPLCFSHTYRANIAAADLPGAEPTTTATTSLRRSRCRRHHLIETPNFAPSNRKSGADSR